MESSAMLTPELVRKIKKVHIRTGRTVNTLMAGQYRSVFRGSGIEFEEVREYSPGDDVKAIDWKVSARLGRPFIKRYREERELVVMLLVDMSGSGGFGTRDRVKREVAAETAAILAFNAVRNNDKVGAILFTDRVEKYIPPKKGTAHVWRVIREVFAFRPEGIGTDIAEAMAFLGRVCRKRSVSFLISDFFDTDYDRSLRLAGQKHELIAVVLSDPGDFTIPAGGLIRVQDLETGAIEILDGGDAATRKAYETRSRERYRAILASLASSDVDAVPLSTDGDAADALIRYFRYREKRKRRR
jgi:uncharacterized protein (DUF58 family)